MANGYQLDSAALEGRKDGRFPFWNYHNTKKIMSILLIIQEKSG